jgi:ATP phosphoribosyltransferase regulatory subunit
MAQGTPQGFRDILPKEALARERISADVRGVFSRAGYLPVSTPLLELRDVLERGSLLADTPFQLFDADELLVMRSDLTLPIARMVTSRMDASDLPLRLRYEASVVREESQLRGQPRQFTQLGVELVGDEGERSEAEVVELLAQALDRLGVPGWKIVCGSVVPLNVLVDACVHDAALADELRRCVHASNFVALDALVDGAVAAGRLAPKAADALRRLPRIAGGAEVVEQIEHLLAQAEVANAQDAVSELRGLVAGAEQLVAQGRLAFDFSIINSFDYYTGSIFKAYADGVAAPLASGGRYDAVFAKLGWPDVAACGFALSLEHLQEVLGEPGATGVVVAGTPATDRPLRIAVPKGSLFGPTVDLLESVGLPIGDLRHPGRRLVVEAGEGPEAVQYVIVRATDAATFVAYGGADCGICGNDSLVEAGVDVLELVDLRYGACRFVVAEPADAAGKAEAAYAWRGSLRVATKYPRITQAYYDRKGVQVDIIQLHGNIELGPIVGMTDRIVDITQTGSTLDQNKLAIVADDVLACSARFFAGPVAWRLDSRVRRLADQLDAAVRKEETA